MFQKEKVYETSKPVMLDPIHLKEKTIIPIVHIDVTILDLKYANIYGRVDSKGIVIIEDDDERVLSLDETYNLEEVIKDMPELREYRQK